MIWKSDTQFKGVASSWADDSLEAARTSRTVAWRVAMAAGAVALLEALALAALQPLKTVTPYVVSVDRQSGYVETVRGLDLGKIGQDSAIAQSFVVQYVIARETFDAADLKGAYHKVMLWSAGEVKGQYGRAMERSNPQSPLNLYPATTQVSTRIKSVSMLSATSALVRFETERRDQGSTGVETRPYTAVLSFRYSGAPMRMEDRFINPLGFQVISYRRDAETSAPLAVAGAPRS